MLVRIAAYTNAIEAHLARLRLEIEGIPAFVAHEHHIWANWLISLALGGVKVYVHKNDISRAAEIIVAHDRGDYALVEEEGIVCPRCGGNRVKSHRLSWRAAMLTTNFAHIPLYFRWATLKCMTCQYEWDLPNTRANPIQAIIITAVITATVLLAIFLTAMCHDNLDRTSIFPISHGCQL